MDPNTLRILFLVLLGATLFFYSRRFKTPGMPFFMEWLSGTFFIITAIGTALAFFFILTRSDPMPLLRQGAYYAGLQQLVDFGHAIPVNLEDNLNVVRVERIDTDADGFQEWVVFYQFDKRAQNSPIHGAVYDNDRGNPPVIFPYLLRAPDRNYLSEQNAFGPVLTVQSVATDRTGPNGTDVPELIVEGENELTIFRFQQNSETWDYPRDIPARYQPIGFFRGDGGVTINLIQNSPGYGQVTVINRNGYERSQLAIRSVYGLVMGPDGNQTYLTPIPPLGEVGGPQLAAPILATVDFDPAPPDELFDTPFPEKLVLGFYAATCGNADASLCSNDNTATRLLWRPDADTSLGSFLTGDALAAFNAGNPGYFGLPAFSGNGGIIVAQLRYYPQTETDPDLLETGGGRDVVTGEQGQVGLVQVNFKVNGLALQEACYQMQLAAGQWKISRRLAASCAEPPPTPTPTPTPTLTPTPTPMPVTVTPPPTIPEAKITAPATASVCEAILFSAAGSEPADQLVTYDWDFGDGNTGNGLNLSYRYTIPRDYNVTLVVRDNAGNSSPPATHTITIYPPPASSPCGPPSCCG